MSLGNYQVSVSPDQNGPLCLSEFVGLSGIHTGWWWWLFYVDFSTNLIIFFFWGRNRSGKNGGEGMVLLLC